jgi:hypothetical protein
MLGVLLIVVVLLEGFSLRVSVVDQAIQNINQHIADMFGMLYIHA